MQKLKYSTIINAPKQKVWETMLNKETYQEWVKAFGQGGSSYEGEWKTGSDISFLGPEKDGTMSGMYGKVHEAVPYDFVSIHYTGEVLGGKENIYGPNEPEYY